MEQHLTQALDLLEDCHRLYLAVPDRLKKLLNQVFFERILVNPAVDENGCPIIPPPALQTSLKAGRRGGTSGQTAATQSGVKTAESAASSRDESAGDQSAGSASQGGHGEAQLDSMHTVHRGTISIIDPASHTAVTGELASPFDQLGSQQLRRAAQQAAMGAAPSQAADCEAPTTRMPVHDEDGRRRCNSGNDSTPTPVTQAKGSYTELVVDRPDSNRRPTRCKRVALPTELQVQVQWRPGARCLSSQCLHTQWTVEAASAGDFTAPAGRATNHLRHGERRMSRGHRGRLSALGWRP